MFHLSVCPALFHVILDWLVPAAVMLSADGFAGGGHWSPMVQIGSE